MYSTLLALHSLFRWLVLVSLMFSIFRGIQGWQSGRSFSKFDNAVRHNTATIAHIQLLLGIWLYSISPIIRYFLNNFKEAVHQREVRFFGMEHSLMMVTAVVLISIGSMKAKRATTDRQQFKNMAIWYAVALVILLSSIPWPFSPLVSRPWFR